MFLTKALSDAEFAEAMAAVGPFEPAPVLCVAVSGGADSLALCLLAERWAGHRGGRVVALSVDHGLRERAAAEARQVGLWLEALGIDHEILCWHGDKPASGIQARARAARYRLLAERCLERGFLHLLVGHHRRDQAETVILRAERGSGPDGLAAMAPVVETDAVRLVRPLLGVAPERLRAYLVARGQPWIEDPTNADARYARSRIRFALADPGAAVSLPDELAQTARAMAAERSQRDCVVATLLARCCCLDPAGFAIIDGEVLLAAPAEAAAAALGRVLTTIGGGDRPPAAAKLERLRQHLRLAGPIGGSLGRCRYWWHHRRTGLGANRRSTPTRGRAMVICREVRGLPPPIELQATTTLWDGRFLVTAGPAPCSGPSRVWLGALGEDGWRAPLGVDPALRHGPIPRPAALTLPALRDEAGLVAVPTLGVCRAGAGVAAVADVLVSFRPRRSLSGTGYFLA